MKPNRIADPLREGKTILGISQMFPSAGITEVITVGWDFVWLDGQHGQLDVRAAADCLRAADLMGVGSLLRVPTHDAGWLGVFADLDPDALMIPMVNTPQEAQAIVRALRFAPQGQRSYGGRRVIDRHGREYFATRHLYIVAQIETLEALENVDAIAATPGIDALFFGPDDVKMQMGIEMNTGTLDHPKLSAALEATARAAQRAGKACGCIATALPALEAMKKMGCHLMVGGGDVPFLRTSAAARLKELRPTPATPAATTQRPATY